MLDSLVVTRSIRSLAQLPRGDRLRLAAQAVREWSNSQKLEVLCESREAYQIVDLMVSYCEAPSPDTLAAIGAALQSAAVSYTETSIEEALQQVLAHRAYLDRYDTLEAE